MSMCAEIIGVILVLLVHKNSVVSFVQVVAKLLTIVPAAQAASAQPGKFVLIIYVLPQPRRHRQVAKDLL